jgi:hypothetical protein
VLVNPLLCACASWYNMPHYNCPAQRVGFVALDALCRFLNRTPGDILTYVPGNRGAINMDLSQIAKDILQFLASDYMTATANVLEVVGFILTIFVFRSLRKLTSYYVFALRTPKSIDKLTKHNKNIGTYLNDFEGNKFPIDRELAEIEVILKSILAKLNRNQKIPVNEALELIVTYHNLRNRDNINKVHLSVFKVVTSLKETQEDMKWEKSI